jgi:hypothetical protein
MKIKMLLFTLSLLITIQVFAQTQSPDLRPTQAEWANSAHTAMLIAGKIYRVVNTYSPIAPRGGEMVMDFAGALPYYMWTYSLVTNDWPEKPDDGSNFAIARIDMKLKIYYQDEKTGVYIAPDGSVLKE